MEVIFALSGIFAALIVCIIILMVILPIYATGGIFVNQPNGLEKSGVHFFTKIEPGQVKIIVRGDKPVRMVMNTSGKKFARNSIDAALTANDPEYWELIDGAGSEDPTADINPLLRPWAKLVYEMTGVVFTGIYPFQRVHEYEIERTAVNRQEVRSGDSDKKPANKQSNIVLTVKRDLSDHFRTRQFLFPMHITAAESNDKIPLDIIGTAEMEVTNPHKAAFGTDRWDHAVINLVTDTIISKTKQMNLDASLTAKGDEDARILSEAVEGIGDDEIFCGIDVVKFRILEINPVLDEEGQRAIQAEAIALQKAKATRIDGEARAAALTSINKANEAGGSSAVASMDAEALVRAAEAAGKGGGTVILTPRGGSGNASDATQVAILAELQKLNRANNQRRN